jgi:hypothetical protein
MQGSNEFRLNEATMMEALQFWMNRSMLTEEKHVKVTSVKQQDDGYSKVFVVNVEPLKTSQS